MMVDYLTALVAESDGRGRASDEMGRLFSWVSTIGSHCGDPVATHNSPVLALAALLDGWIATAHEDGLVRMRDPRTGDTLAEFAGHTGSVRALALLPDGRLASGGDDGTIRFVDIETGGASGEPIAVTPDGVVGLCGAG